MKNEAFNGCKLALLQGTKLLVYKRDEKDNIPYPGQLDLPGGGRECDETPEQCVLRELYEEFSIKLPAIRLIYRQKYSLSQPGEFAYFFVAELSEHESQAIVFGDEGQSWLFMDIEDYLASPWAITHLKKRIVEYLDYVKLGSKQ